VTESFLHEQLVEIHLWDWYAHDWSAGAFAMFGPAEFSTVMPSLLKPAFHGKVHFAGEALSSGHAWVIGAVNSAYRTVAEVLAVEKRDDLLAKLVEKWGTIDEVDMGWYRHS
jgi:monoamine oxidase